VVRARARNQAGVALVVVLLVLALLLSLGAMLSTTINMDTVLGGAYDRATAGFYAAESGLNRGIGEFRNIFLSYNVPSGSDLAPHTMMVGQRTVTYQATDATTYDAQGNPPSITIPTGLQFGGLNTVEYDYVVNSAAAVLGKTESRVSAEVKVGYIPLFQFAAFYTKDLEISPGPNMTLNGRVHTNGNLYLSAGATLLISDNPPSVTTVQVTAQGNIYRGRKDANLCDSPGTVTVDMLQDVVAPLGRLDPQDLNCGGSGTRLVPPSELATWKGSMASQVGGISPPSPDIVTRGSGSFWSKADLRIVFDVTDGAIEVEDASGLADAAKTARLKAFILDTAFNTANSKFPGTRPIFYTDVPITSGAPNNCNCTNAAPSNCTNAVAACYSPAFASDARVYGTGVAMTTDTDLRRGGFYNWREQKWMYLLNVNVQDLLAWNMAQTAGNQLFDPADRTDGGLVLFLSVKGPDAAAAANNYGVRVFGSPTLPFPASIGTADPTGVTLVSDQAIYVLGDFNGAATIAAGKQPAAIIGDSVNVLSNAYFSTTNAAAIVTTAHVNDRQSNDNLNQAPRVASATTIHAAFLSGVDDTIPGTSSSGFNGGLENYPRFHEDWSGVPFNYLGSFVSLGNPQHVNGLWCGTGTACNIYNPPDRNWNFDADFNSVANLPPLTPRFVYVQQILFTEDFK
jgi:hypothetical protein